MGAIKRISLSQQVLTSILDYIRDNQLRVGDKLPTESEFSKRFQVSRTSVREAMKVLNFNCAVESIPGKGAFIREPMLSFLLNTEENLVDQANVSVSQVMEVRLAVELLAAAKECADLLDFSAAKRGVTVTVEGSPACVRAARRDYTSFSK